METLQNGQNASLVMLAFLQADCRDSDYSKELNSLGTHWPDSQEDEGLECDGHLPCSSSSITELLHGIQPVDREEAAALRGIAEDLREVAAQLEHNVVARATQNLSRNIQVCPSEQWTYFLANEVERVMRQGVGLGLEHLPQERVIVALTLTLVRGVCEQAPRMLIGLFNSALQYIWRAGPR
uniref:BH3-interacting domain death agonist n=1 Tax=Stegastes partitus TaxID=144197 RepID=A0A3B4ZSR6_9TELE